MTLASLGLAASVWHILLDTGVVSEGTSCDPNNPCTLRWGWAGDGLGQWFATIQVGAFCCFLFIIGVGLHALAPRSTPTALIESGESDHSTTPTETAVEA